MWQKEKKDSLIAGLGLFMALTATGVAVVSHESESALADPSSESKKAFFPLPESVPNGTKIRIDGSSSIDAINQALKQGFEKKFPGSNVEIATNGTQKALKDLSDGKIDIAAISRGLTPEEKAKGLEQLRLRREKIAVIVSKENPFEGSITNEQFAKIFRGEITDWSQLGALKGKIRLIDHPETSETRQSFRSYPVFQKAKFTTGGNTHLLDSHHAVEVVKHLGKDGIGYVIANQVSQLNGVRVLKMHQTLPNDPKYPYSQPLVYVYKQKPGSSIASFLGFSTANLGQKAIELARKKEAQDVAQAVVKNSLLATDTASNSSSKQNQANSTTDGTELLDGGVKKKATNVSDNNSTFGQTKPGENQNSLEDVGTLTASNGNAVSGTYNKQILAQKGQSSSSSTAGIPLWGWLLLASALGGGGLMWFFASKGKSIRNEKDELEANSGVSLDAFDRGGMATATALGGVGAAMGGAANKLEDKKIARVSNSKTLNYSNNVSSGAVATGTVTGLNSENSTTDLPDTAIGKTALQVDEAEWNLEAPAAIVNDSIRQVAGINESTVDKHPIVRTAEVDITCNKENQKDSSSSYHKVAATGLAAGLAATVGSGKVLSEFAKQDTDTDTQNSDSPNTATNGTTAVGTISDETAATGFIPKLELADENPGLGEKIYSDINRQQLPIVRITTSDLEDLEDLEDLKIDNSDIDTINSVAANGLPIVEITTPLTDNISQRNENLPELPELDVVTDTYLGVSEDLSNSIGNVAVAGAVLAAGVGLGSHLSEQDSTDNDGVTDTTPDPTTDVVNETNVSTISYPPLPDVWDEVSSEQTNNSADTNSDSELPNVSEEILDKVANAAEPLENKTDEVTTNMNSDVVTDGATDESVTDVTSDVATGEIVTDEVVTDLNADIAIDEITDEVTDVTADIPNIEMTATDTIDREVIDEEIRDVTPSIISDEVSDSETTDFAPEITNEKVTEDEKITEVAPDVLSADVVADDEAKTDEVKDENVASVNPIAVAGGVVGAGAALIGGIWSNDAVKDKLSDSDETGIVLTPRTPRWAYTAWKISTADKEQLQQQGDTQLILRLYDVTDIDLSYQTPHLVQQYECEISINHRYVAIPKGDRNYMVEIGYLSNDQRWLSLGRSEMTRILSSPHQDFWFEADAELIIHGATEPGATVTIGGNSIKVKPNGTFHLRIPFTEEVMEYLMMSSAANSNKSKTIGMKFSQEKPKFQGE